MSNETILIIDDDPRIRELLTQYLNEQGFKAQALSDGIEMDHWLKEHQPELIILDLMLPGEDGLSLARRIRSNFEFPIIMLTARGEELDRIIGLEVGADDYMAKPFNPRELLARIRAVLRRSHPVSTTPTIDSGINETQFLFGDFTLNPDERILRLNGKEISLTHGEMSLLLILVDHPNRILSRDQLMDMLSNSDRDPFDRSIDVRITRLRQKIEPTPSKPRFIRTVWGQGYRFTPNAASEPLS